MGSEDDEDSEDVPLGTFLFGALPDSEIDSVEAVRELREQERDCSSTQTSSLQRLSANPSPGLSPEIYSIRTTSSRPRCST